MEEAEEAEEVQETKEREEVGRNCGCCCVTRNRDGPRLVVYCRTWEGPWLFFRSGRRGW